MDHQIPQFDPHRAPFEMKRTDLDSPARQPPGFERDPVAYSAAEPIALQHQHAGDAKRRDRDPASEKQLGAPLHEVGSGRYSMRVRARASLSQISICLSITWLACAPLAVSPGTRNRKSMKRSKVSCHNNCALRSGSEMPYF